MANIKKLFEQGQDNKLLTNSSLSELGDPIESADFVKSRTTQATKFIPNVDFTTASNFSFYGLAEEYYRNSIDHITHEYPYDGSEREKINWELSGTYLDKYIFDNVYPRTNGYVNIGYNYGTTTGGGGIGDFQPTTTQEYIKFYGGPNKASGYDSSKKISNYFTGSNVYATGSRQVTNIDIDGTKGFSVEFWLKKPSYFVGTQSDRQVILDIWNNSSIASSKGSVLIFIQKSESNKMYVNVTSGSVASQYRFTITETDDLGDNVWRHYALVFKNDGSNLTSKHFVNGVDKGAATLLGGGGSIGAITGSMVGYIGALSANPDYAGEGAGKLSGSLDELRLWKTQRTEKDIQQNWFTNVNGGSNTDYELVVSSSKKFDLSNNVDLGVYFKFNEGIIDTSSINSQDAVVLDYAGRSSNGTWTGYSIGSRETGSAMVLSNAAKSEFKDPIIYSSNPAVSSLRTQYIDQGKMYDAQNNSALYWSLPSWITSDDQNKSNSALKNLTQILGSQFDKLQLQMSAIKDVKERSFNAATSGSYPNPFMSQVLRSYGLENDEILSNATALEYLASRNETENFEEKLNNTKNLIYLNLYNNLVDIYKSKGTEKAFRNLIRCFGVDESIVNLNLYGSNVDYELRENERYSVVRKKAIDFFDPSRFGATIYQSSSTSNTGTRSFIDFTNLPVNAGSTFECQTFFKPTPLPNLSNSFSVNFVSSSIFGAHTAGSGDNFGWPASDVGNFQVYSVKKNIRRNEAFFLLTGTAGGFIPEITSSVFKDVYGGSKWNLSVRVYPEEPFVGAVSSSTGTSNYLVRFTGFQYILDDLVNSFDVSSSLTNANGTSFLQADKRMFVGAHRQNYTGSVLQRSDAQISNCKVYAQKIENEQLKVHAKNLFNFGVKSPGNNPLLAVTGTELGLNQFDLPSIKTLALNWDFETVSASTAAGAFTVPDYSSGSSTPSGYDFLNNITQYQHSGRGFGFPASSTKIFERKFVNSSIEKKPEVINSSNMVSIVSETDDELFTRTSRPIDYYFSFEKSMYNVISQDMLNMFATIIDFNNIIGEPVYRYRPEYKNLEKLRQLYFQNVQNDPDFEKFLEYYKWIDASISTMLMQLAPASANFLDGMKNMVESHVLERNKYWSKFPTLDSNQPADVEGTALGRMEQDRAVSINPPASDPCPGGSLIEITLKDGSKETICSYTEEESANLSAEMLFSPAWYGGGSNTPNKQKNYDYFKDRLEPGVSTELTTNRNTVKKQNYNNVIKDELQKDKLNFAVDDSSVQGGYGIVKGDGYAPFSFYSSSATSGYIKQIRDNFVPNDLSFNNDGTTASVEITNYHEDGYNMGEIPMQGPFPQEHVGGNQYRHQGIVTTPQTDGDLRGEAWNLAVENNSFKFTSRNLTQARATRFRNTLAKRPLNIKNIKYNSNSTVIGNYERDYEIFQTSGRTINDRYFIKTEGAAPYNASSSYVKDLFDYDIPRYDLTGTNKSIFVNRFGAPGGPETHGGGLNVYGAEFSVYNTINYRNLAVRSALNSWYTEHAGQFGIKSGTAVSADNYDTPGAYHKTNRNPRVVREENGGCSVIYDNWWIQHAIPQSIFQNAWISASVSKSSCDTLGYFTSFTLPSGATAVTQSVPFIKQADINASGIYVDFVGLNTLVNEEVYSRLNLLSSSTGIYKNTSIATLTDGEMINALNLHRNGPYEFSSWRQVRAGQNPVTRFHKKNNIMSAYSPPVIVNLKDGDGTGKDVRYINKRPDAFNNFIQPPISFKNKPLLSKVRDQEGNETTLVHTYGNKDEYFSQPIGITGSLSDYINFQDPTKQQVYDQLLNSSNLTVTENHYGEVIYPRDGRTGLAQTRTRVNYAEVASSSNGNAVFSTGSNGIDRGPLYRRSFWRNAASNRNRRSIFTGTQYTTKTGVYQLTSAVRPTLQTTLPNSQGYLDGAATSILGFGRTPLTFPDTNFDTFVSTSYYKAGVRAPQSLYPPPNPNSPILPDGLQDPGPDFASGTAHMLSLFPDTGELNSANWQTIAGYIGISSGSAIRGNLAYQTTFHPTASAYYYHRSKTLGNKQVASLNKLAWRTAELSGKNPWFDSYQDYTADISKLAQNFTIIPEFKISDHMDYYSEFNFRKPNDKFLILHGANITASAFTQQQSSGKRAFNQAFFNEYSNSDFQKYFGKFSNDLNLKRITLTCNGVKKLLPYMGFYPAHRSLQLASLFSQSIGPHISGLGWRDGAPISSNDAQSGSLAVQSMLQPYYAPGILYNTIKSGIACDWGAYTSSFNSDYLNSSTDFGINLTQSSNYRIPFESILDPLGSVGIPSNAGDLVTSKLDLLYPTYTGVSQPSNVGDIAFNQPRQPFAFMNEEARTKAISSGEYNLYRLGINNFLAEIPQFFLEEQKLKSITSKRQDEISLVSGTSYYMDVILEKDKKIVMMQDYLNEPDNGQPLTITQYRTYNGQFFGPPVNGSPNVTDLVNPVCTSYYDPIGEFGYTKHPENAGDPFYAQYTPPYFYGKAKATVKYTADTDDEKGNFTFKKLFEKAEVTYGNDGLRKTLRNMQKKSVLVPWGVSNTAQGGFECSASSASPFSGDYFILSRSSGGGAFDFGASSSISQPVNPGQYFEWQVLSTDKDLVVGLNSSPPAGTNYTDMNFSMRVESPGSTIKIYENGVEVYDIDIVSSAAPNDWYRIRSDDLGTVFYEQCKQTSAADTSYPNGRPREGDNDLVNINGVSVKTFYKYGDPNAWQTLYVSETRLTGAVFPDASFKADGSTIAYAQVSNNNFEEFPAEKGAMNINASLNTFGILTEKQSRFNENGDLVEVVDDPSPNRNRWIISPKMETPVLDFSNQPRVEQFGRGMWSGYGQLLTSSNGVTFGIEETFKDGFNNNSGSLVEKCFDTSQIRKVGEVADVKKVSEAIVAIPYSPVSYNRKSKYAETTPVLDRNFFRIKTRTYDFYKKWYDANKNGNLSSIPKDAAGQERPSESLTHMLSVMGDYVMPPELDFMTYDKGRTKINPFAVYIFEFNHYFDATDLSDIWQGVMPKISTNPEFSDPSVDNNVFSHLTGKDEFFHGKQLPPDTRWMVFKVKKRATYNYFEVTPTNSDDEQFNLAFSLGKEKKLTYSYNWPYDFFSLVELAQVETENTFVSSDEDAPPNNALSEIPEEDN